MTVFMKSEVGGQPLDIRAGYTLAGNPLAGSDYVDMSFVAPFGVAAMVDRGNQAWLDALWGAIVDDDGGGYYGDSIKLLSMLVMSGNWWAPEAAPCGG